jgi:ankyrin repeat protein
MASANGHTEIVKLLLDKGADLNVKNTYGITVLFMASVHGHTEIAKLLLDRWR